MTTVINGGEPVTVVYTTTIATVVPDPIPLPIVSTQVPLLVNGGDPVTIVNVTPQTFIVNVGLRPDPFITVSDTPPPNPYLNDVWIDTR